MSTVIEAQPIVTALCHEPEGDIIRSVYPMPLSRGNIMDFWERAKNYRTLFNDEITGDFKRFCELFISQEEAGLKAHGLIWRIDDLVGVYYMTHIYPFDAQVHFVFFDRRYKGRENITRRVLAWAFEHYGFRRLSAEIPMYSSQHTFGFAYRVGFRSEGRKRKAIHYKGDWFDVGLYGILREEIENGH